MSTAFELIRKQRRGERIVEEHTDKKYIVCGKYTNKNVWELQQLYEKTQAKTTKVLPEFFERIRYMIVRGIIKATYNSQVDQNGELFNYVVESLLNKIIPTKDPKTKKLTTKYDNTKTNLGAYILNSCYWSVRAYQNNEKENESSLSCAEFLEDYDEASYNPIEVDVGEMKLISSYESSNTYVPLVQSILQGDSK